jgi:tetratricopeptide (TPR) repeat protein
VSRPYRRAIRQVDQLIDAGNSLSGNEPNCGFLNLGDGTFATVSALSGIDFPDDARALALTDWDGDGDLDVWVSNRTAPMLRFLRNEAPAGRSLMVRLEGLDASRDAAGARVEVRLHGAPDRPLVRTVKLGEGYLGQGSRWLHFGLGGEPVIDSVRVRWPGGRTDALRGVRADTAVTFTQGDAFPVSAPLKKPGPAGAAAPLAPEAPSLAGAVTLFHPLPFPSLPSERPDGTAWTVDDTAGPTLVNVFASWCPDCTSELEEWSASADAFRQAGVSPVVLSADGRDSRHDTTPQDAWKWLKAKGVPFAAGVLTDEAFRRLTRAHQQAFGAIVNLPIPTSFLLDGHGRLAAVYRGPVQATRVLADVAALEKAGPGASQSTALPFRGRWLQEPDPPDPAFWVNDLAAAGAWDETLHFFARHRDTLRRHRDFVLMAGALGGKLAEAGRHQPAIACYREALAKSPDHPDILNNLASLLATAPDPSLRRPKEAVDLATKATQLTGGSSASLLDTLASAHAAAGDFQAAAAAATRALELARKQPDQASLIPALEKALAAYREGRLP